jgi:16S rRNA (guanine527-N7)-methyltransferase
MMAPTAEQLNVSRETLERLKKFAELLIRWNPKINLVSKSSIQYLWQRHIADSLQFLDLAPPSYEHWVDLGSGAGFPGLVVAMATESSRGPKKYTFVESDTRKAAFLRTVIRETGISASVSNDRIEILPPMQANVLSARALTDLSGLLKFAELHLDKKGTALFAKGASWQKELDDAQQKWNFTHEAITSKTEPSAVVLRIKGISRV